MFYIGVWFSFIRQVHDPFIPLNLLVEIRVLTKRVNYAKDLDLIVIGDNLTFHLFRKRKLEIQRAPNTNRCWP